MARIKATANHPLGFKSTPRGWSVVASPNATSGHNNLAGVAALPGGTVVAVGTAGNATTGNTNGLILKK